ncbi:serine hydrolase domain-containing protein [Siphonobacter sp.]|uniref:serine hydrolase domain-containing protein n=1 Tax=Siphonobacter sp. TaxID=1869184 RepID=UPI003B3B2ECE
MRLFIFILAILTSINAWAQESDFDREMLVQMKRLQLPGLAVAKVEAGKVAWSGYYGYQNLEQRIPVSAQTVFHIASLSKPITAAALMQLSGRGYFSLDDAINRFLPFSVKNPHRPNQPITFRHLLRHRSSIHDDLDYLLPFWETAYQGPPLDLEPFLRNYLTPRGTNYRPEKNFIPATPGSTFDYSNMGYAILGYLVEKISKMPFDAYCQKNLFAPLGMNQTAWFPNQLDSSTLATPYVFSDSLQAYQPQPQRTFPDYPAGQLRCSLDDLATFLIGWTSDGTFQGKTIIDSGAVQTLTPKDMSLGFHTWFMYIFNTETPMYSHNGHEPGVSTYMLYDPFSKKGLIILSNGDLTSYTDWRKLIDFCYRRP